MAHIHGVSDIDTHFIIDPITRAMKNETLKKTTLILGDHNSERFTFELPRIVEGHDMATCNKVEVHFLNMDAETKQTSKGIYIVDDFGVDPDDETKVVCSWLIDQNATKYKGVLNFVVRYVCTADGTQLDYVWSTAIYSGVSVADGICNTENVLAAYIDVLEKWKAELYESETAEVLLIDIDNYPTDGSNNLVTSGACKKYFDDLFKDAVNTKYTMVKSTDGKKILLKGTDGSSQSVDDNDSSNPFSQEWSHADTGQDVVLTAGTWQIYGNLHGVQNDRIINFGTVYFDGQSVDTYASSSYYMNGTLYVFTLEIEQGGSIIFDKTTITTEGVSNEVADFTVYYRKLD